MSDGLEWRQWPSPGQPGSELFEPEPKVAHAHSYADLSVEGFVTSVVSTFEDDLPEGIDKVASLRPGTDEQLPVPTKQTIWRHPNAHPAALMLLLIDKYGQALFDWEADSLIETMRRDKIAVSNAVRTKILAARVAMNSPSPWRQWHVLHWTCLGLAGEQPNFTFMEEPELGHLIAGYDFMKMVDPQRITTDEVDKFIAAVFKHDGHVWIPQPLQFAQRELEDRKIKCLGCDALHRDDDDIRCLVCGSKKIERIPYAYAEARDESKALFTKLKRLPLEVAVQQCPTDTAVGNAVYRLLVQWDYAAQERARLRQQIKALSR